RQPIFLGSARATTEIYPLSLHDALPIFKNRGAHVPFHHQYLLAQLIKGILLFGSNPAYKDYTRFNFSGLKGQTKISRKGLHFYSSKVTLVFACQDKDFMDYFLERLFEQKEIVVGTLQLIPD